MRNSLATLFTTALIAVFLLPACVSDELPEPTVEGCDNTDYTYEEEVRPIIEQTCAYAGCHLGAAPGIYDDYDGMLSALQSGSFQNRVITLAADPNLGMPPNYAPTIQEDLTEEQMEIISCWLDAGFPR